jgi:prepilin-type N-terminal cleavage/methylation domain-containing protein/prepilin-type processing-associated H-X9-DG protein
MLHRRNGRLAFTLVELLVVIGIIAVLISILLPALGMARRHAQDVVCESNFRQFGMAIQMFANNNQGFLPIKGPDGSTLTNSFGPTTNGNGVKGYDDDTIWFNALPPMINGKTYYQMVLDYSTSKEAVQPPNWENNKSIFTCPLMGPPHTQYAGELPSTADYYQLWGIDSTNAVRTLSGMASSKVFPCAMVYVWNSKLQSSNSKPDLKNLKIDNCAPASSIVLMTEKLANYEEYRDKDVQTWNNDNPTFYKSPGKINANGYAWNIGQTKADWTRFTTRHHGGGYLLFADGHVQWYGWTGVQYQGAQLTAGYTPSSDANQYGMIEWSVQGPVN